MYVDIDVAVLASALDCLQRVRYLGIPQKRDDISNMDRGIDKEI